MRTDEPSITKKGPGIGSSSRRIGSRRREGLRTYQPLDDSHPVRPTLRQYYPGKPPRGVFEMPGGGILFYPPGSARRTGRKARRYRGGY